MINLTSLHSLFHLSSSYPLELSRYLAPVPLPLIPSIFSQCDDLRQVQYQTPLSRLTVILSFTGHDGKPYHYLIT